MQNKRILFIVPSVYPHKIGGIEVFNYYIIQELGKDYDVAYLTRDKRSNEEEIKNSKRVIFKSTAQIVELFQILFFLIKSRKSYDLIWTSFSKTAWYYIAIYPFLKIFFSKEYLIVVHGGGLMPWKFKYPYKLFFKKAKVVVGVSNTICKEYKKRTGIDIIHIPPLIPFVKALGSKENLRDKHKIGRSKKVFLYVGSLKILKRPNVIVESLYKLGNEFLKENNILMIFAGDGMMKKELMRYCKNKGLSEFTVFMGNVKRDIIPELYHLSDYYIISSDFEGTPISMLEAMFNKLPIIASNVRGINGVIDKNTSILFDNKEKETLIIAIIKILSDEKFSILISNNSFNSYNEKYSYNKMIDKYKGII